MLNWNIIVVTNALVWIQPYFISLLLRRVISFTYFEIIFEKEDKLICKILFSSPNWNSDDLTQFENAFWTTILGSQKRLYNSFRGNLGVWGAKRNRVHVRWESEDPFGIRDIIYSLMTQCYILFHKKSICSFLDPFCWYSLQFSPLETHNDK